ncbi:MAG: hypothetical protein JXX28_04650 [Deltaproteobacteria bacterium]|nr:hypothetical protein [Deltaproteobacteria bacterium]
MLLSILLLPFAWADGPPSDAPQAAPRCEHSMSAEQLKATLSEGEAAAIASDIWSFRGSHGRSLAAVRCLDALVEARAVTLLHTHEALAAQVRGDEPAAVAAFVAAQAHPAVEAPGWLGASDTAIRARWTEATRAEPQVWERVRLAPEVQLWIDGERVWARPVGHPAVAQITDATGAVLWSAYLTGAQPLPSEYATPGPELLGSEGDEALALAVRLLNQGDYAQALRVSVPAVSKYPGLSLSFLAVAQLAMNHQDTHPGGYPTGSYAPLSPYLAPGELEATPITPRGSGVLNTGTFVPPKGLEHGGGRLLMGVDMGLPTGFRAEWKFPADEDEAGSLGTLDSVGMRMGMGWMIPWQWYSGTTFAMLGTLDWGAGMDLQVETSMGMIYLIDWGGSLAVGSALQYDPKGPFQASLGGYIDVNGVTPEASVAFLW